jgi:hypothetical protein
MFLRDPTSPEDGNMDAVSGMLCSVVFRIRDVVQNYSNPEYSIKFTRFLCHVW